ncbi:hypothetical protein C8R42DRAFT_646653 [Lentinula raphanica]|nr:hypothetical protein C8R42DRAFT_646653 [Lentinula raphanica]
MSELEERNNSLSRERGFVWVHEIETNLNWQDRMNRQYISTRYNEWISNEKTSENNERVTATRTRTWAEELLQINTWMDYTRRRLFSVDATKRRAESTVSRRELLKKDTKSVAKSLTRRMKCRSEALETKREKEDDNQRAPTMGELRRRNNGGNLEKWIMWKCTRYHDWPLAMSVRDRVSNGVEPERGKKNEI